jgi:hypothetical protein
VFIRYVDESLERLLRATLPMPADAGDIAYDAPTAEWLAGLSRPTVNLFLYDVAPSRHTAGTILRRVDVNGRAERRAPPPVIQLGYLVSTWAPSALEQHELLSNVLNRIAGVSKLPDEYVVGVLSSTPMLSMGDDENNWLRQIWSAVGAGLRASFTFRVTVAADSDWDIEPPAPETVVADMRRTTPK